MGANDGSPREQATERLAHGQVLLLYSDGLVEKRDENLDLSLDRLAAAAGALPRCSDLRSATEALIQQLDSPTKVVDDTALLGLRRHR